MPIRAQAADGSIHEFPEGTAPEVIDRVMKAYAQGGEGEAPRRATGDRPPEALTETAPGEFTGESGARYSEKPRQPQLVADLEDTNRLSPEGLPSVEDLRGSIFRNILGKEPTPSPNAFGAFAQGAGLSALPTLVGYGAMRGGAALGALAGPAAPILSPTLAVGLGVGGALTTAEAQERALDALPEDVKARFGLSEEQIAASREAYPYTFNFGQLAPSLLTGRPFSAESRQALMKAAREVNPALAARLFGKAVEEAAPTAALSAGAGATGEAVGQFFDGNKDPDIGKIAQSALVSGLTGYNPRSVSALERSLIGTQQPTAVTDELQMGALRLGAEPTPLDVLPRDVLGNLASDVARVNPQAGRELERAADQRVRQLPGALSTVAEGIPGVPPGATVTGVTDAAEAARFARQARITSGKTNIVRGAEAEQEAAKAAKAEASEGVLPETRGGAPAAYTELQAQRDAARSNFKRLYDDAEAAGDVALPADAAPTVADELAATAKSYAGTLEAGEAPATERIVAKVTRALEERGGLTFMDLNSLRRQLQPLTGRGDTDSTAARDVIRKIDEVEDRLFDAGAFGDSDVVQKWRAANQARREFGQNWENNVFERILAGQDPQAMTVTMFGTAAGAPVRGPNREADISAVMGRLSPEARAAVQQDAMDRLFSKDVGKDTFGKAFTKWERENPELAALLVPEEGRNALIRAQGEIKAATEASEAAKARGARATERAKTLMAQTEDAFKARVEPASQGRNFLSESALDFRNAVDGWTPSQRQTAKVGVRQAMRDAVAKPDASIRLLVNLADNTDAQANLRVLLGNAEADAIILKAVSAQEVVKRLGAVGQGARTGLGAAPSEPDMMDLAPDILVKSGPMGARVDAQANFFQSAMRLLTAKGLSSAEALQVSRDLLDPAKVDAVRDQLAKQIGEGPADAARRRAQAFYGPVSERLGIAATRAAVTQREPPPQVEAPVEPPAEEEKAEFTSLTAPTPEAAITVASTVELPPERAAEIAAPIIANERVEGTGDNPRSSALGYGQFINPTFIAYYRKAFPKEAEGLSEQDILAKRGTGVERRMMDVYTQDNVNALAQNGMKLTLQNLYALHHMGAPLGLELLRARPDQPAEQVLGADVIQANPHFGGMTVGQARDWLASHAAKGVPLTQPGAA
jgi:hypothetical protein